MMAKSAKTLTAEIKRMIDNPFETDGVFQHKRLSDPTYAGKHEVTSNELTRIGALCFIPMQDPRKPYDPSKRQEHHNMSAQRFKTGYEMNWGGTLKAVDPGNEPVSSSLTAHDGGAAARIDRGRQFVAIVNAIPKDDLDALIACVCWGIPARHLEGDWRQAQQRNQRVLLALSRLSRFWGYSSGEKAA